VVQGVSPRSEVPVDRTWDVESVLPSDEAWNEELRQLAGQIPKLERFRGHLADGASTLVECLSAAEDLYRCMGRAYIYAHMKHDVDTADQSARAMNDQSAGLWAQLAAANSFVDPEILQIGFDTLRRWMADEPQLAIYEHYFDQLERRQQHVRSTEVEELLGMVLDPFSTASGTHATLTDTDMVFAPARTSGGEEIQVAQGNIGVLLTDTDREVRRTAWESQADAHLALKNTMADCLSAGVKQDVFLARVRKYGSSLEAALSEDHIPVEVYRNLIDAYRRNLPTWHRYWSVHRRALGYEQFHEYDIKAPLTQKRHTLPYEQAVDWIVEGMRPLGSEYVDVLRRGSTVDRWVDVYPNQGKRSGAYSTGFPGTRPFVLMSYNDDLYGMSTLAHELGHSMHSYFSWKTQPFVYSGYSLFIAEVASNFNQALVREHLLRTSSDPDFQIALIEEAMSNFHRYFFIMPTLARFELEIHERVERGEALTADALTALMAELFREGYGDEVELDVERTGITWAEFSGHLYANFYVYQYATGISAAQALAHRVLEGGREAAGDYLAFLSAGSSLYPLDALKLAGVDMTSPEPVEHAFTELAQMVDRLQALLEKRLAETPVSKA
jgi:oligoendopeptidase F